MGEIVATKKCGLCQTPLFYSFFVGETNYLLCANCGTIAEVHK